MADANEPILRIRKNLGRVLGAGHPWVYRDALDAFDLPPGTPVQVHDKKGAFVARGFTESGAIGVRIFTTRDEPLGHSFFERRFKAAFGLRQALVASDDTTVYRLCHGEGDRLPGIALDHYGAEEGDFVVLRLDGEAAPSLEAMLVEVLTPILKKRGTLGLLSRIGRSGQAPRLAWGEAPPDQVKVRECGMVLCADLWRGQKTGLFLDHRESRKRVRSLAKGRRVLNLYAYTGGFSVAAGLGGASHVTTVDVAPAAIALSEASWAANDLKPGRHTALARDVRTHMEQDSQMYELIVSDPPSFAPNEKSVEKALGAYEQLHASCLKRLLPGGIFVAASCSSHVRGADFDETIAKGASRAGRVLQVLHRGSAPPDHPRLLAFPEGDYLDVVVARSLG
ncbi:MAG: class I SAM-dependent rRNA methyltransferase [Polyangiales bacterium]